MKPFNFDAEYLERVKTGNDDIRNDFFSYCSELITTSLKSSHYSPSAIDDFTQKISLRLWTALPEEKVRDPQKLRAYVSCICQNVLRDAMRRQLTPPTVDLEQLTERQLHDAVVQAERVILRAIFLDNTTFQPVANVLLPVDFSIQSHQLIFESMAELMRVGRDINFINLIKVLAAQGRIADVGVEYFTGVIEVMPQPRNIEKHVEFILEVRKQRSAKAAGAGRDASNSRENGTYNLASDLMSEE